MYVLNGKNSNQIIVLKKPQWNMNIPSFYHDRQSQIIPIWEIILVRLIAQTAVMY